MFFIISKLIAFVGIQLNIFVTTRILDSWHQPLYHIIGPQIGWPARLPIQHLVRQQLVYPLHSCSLWRCVEVPSHQSSETGHNASIKGIYLACEWNIPNH